MREPSAKTNPNHAYGADGHQYDLSIAFGTADQCLQSGFMRQLENAVTFLPLTSRDSHVNAMLAMLVAMQPRDVFETPLMIQMVVTHNAGIDCHRHYAEAGRDREAARIELELAFKASKTYARLKEALDRHRGLGSPAMNVEQLNVQAGAQAIVGVVDASRRSPRKNLRKVSPPALEARPVESLDLGCRDKVEVEDKRLKRYVE